jgi:hypothetical protein
VIFLKLIIYFRGRHTNYSPRASKNLATLLKKSNVILEGVKLNLIWCIPEVYLSGKEMVCCKWIKNIFQKAFCSLLCLLHWQQTRPPQSDDRSKYLKYTGANMATVKLQELYQKLKCTLFDSDIFYCFILQYSVCLHQKIATKSSERDSKINCCNIPTCFDLKGQSSGGFS